MDRACQQLFAGAALASDHDARIGARDHVRLRQTLFHDRAARDDLAAPVFGGIGEAGNLECLADLVEQFLLIDRLGEERESAALRRLHRIRNRAVRGEDDDAQPRRAALDFLEQADAVHLVHAQVGDHEVRTHAPERGERSGRTLDCVDFVVFRAQTNREQPQQPRIVVND
jgi:hypothetical protein